MKFLTWILPLLAGALLALTALADSDDEPRRLTAYDCDRWTQHIEDLQGSNQSLERELGELYGQPEMQYCQVQSVRITETRESEWNFNWPDWSGVAWLMRALAVAGLLGLVVWLIWRWGDRIRDLRIRRDSRKPPPGPTSRPAREPSVLPDDVPGTALAAWQAGHPREAMSLLYRGAVARLLPEKRAGEARTEREVIHALKQAGKETETLAWMRSLVSSWLSTAWANRPPNEDEFLQLQQQWSKHCLDPTGADR